MTATTTSRTPAALVMTATINPPTGMPGVKRSNPKIRMDDYCKALSYYLSLPSHYIDRILFIENSGSDLSILKSIARSVEHNKKVDFIGFTGNYKPEYGKAYGEFNMLDYGISKSHLLSDIDIFWKVTGRLKISNLCRIIDTAPQKYQVYCDLRSVPFIGERFGSNNWMELRLYSCAVNAYKKIFYSRFSTIHRRNACLEKDCFTIVQQLATQDRTIVPRFRLQPVFDGYGAHRNVNYQGLAYKTKEIVRTTARLIAPWLWL